MRYSTLILGLALICFFGITVVESQTHSRKSYKKNAYEPEADEYGIRDGDEAIQSHVETAMEEVAAILEATINKAIIEATEDMVHLDELDEDESEIVYRVVNAQGEQLHVISVESGVITVGAIEEIASGNEQQNYYGEQSNNETNATELCFTCTGGCKSATWEPCQSEDTN